VKGRKKRYMPNSGLGDVGILRNFTFSDAEFKNAS
jgi:hypothetical protein